MTLEQTVTMQTNAKTPAHSKGISFHHGKRHFIVANTLAGTGVKTSARASKDTGAELQTFDAPLFRGAGAVR